jgi:hypothetical protein
MSITANKNFLSPNGYRLTIDMEEFADVEYFCVSATLPTVSIAPIATPFRNLQNTTPGEKVEYALFDLRYMITENMENYVSLFNWITKNANEEGLKYADMTLSILNSNNNLIRQVRFIDAFPVSIGALEFRTQNADVEYITGDVSFSYSHFEFSK